MGVESWRVETPEGKHVGWIGYQNTADVWCAGTFCDSEIEDANLIGRWRCEATLGGHVLDDVVARYDIDEVAYLKWCGVCQVVVHPPFDGYVYHDYGCRMGDECRCDHG